MKAFLLSGNDIPEIETFLQKIDFVPIQQSPAWGDFQKELGSTSCKIGIRDESNSLVAFSQVFEKKWPFGFKWLHVPRGPVLKSEVRSQKSEVLDLIFGEIKKIVEERKAIFVRFDWHYDFLLNPTTYNLEPTTYTNFPDTTLVLDLEKSEEELLAQMKPKGRYNIRVAEKHGVKVKETKDSSGAKIFYDLLKKTTARDGFSGHPLGYYEKFINFLGKQNLASFFFAERDGNPIAASLCTFYGDTVTYYYGASDYEFRNLMAPYAVQWAAIRAAKEKGFKYYDFLGISPDDSKSHPLVGVTSFKKKFGGRVVSYPKSSELISRLGPYRLINLIKKIKG